MITWNTTKGSLGTLKELEYNEIALSATDSDNETLSYIRQSGDLPTGMYVTLDGVIKGVPTITANTSERSVAYSFTIRAANPSGIVADRSFSIVITNQSTLSIVPNDLYLSVFDDGKLLQYQFNATSENPNAALSWSIISGEVPNDIRTGQPISLSPNGLLSGYIDRLIDTTGASAGYDVETDDSFPYDFNNVSRSKIYNFQIQVSDGFVVSKAYVRLNVVSKAHYTADNNITVINDTNLTVDADNHYVPIIVTDVTTIPTLQAGNKFTFKFDAIDPEDDVVYWSGNNIPNGFTISSVTGWLVGTAPAQTEEQKTYTFTVRAYKRDNPLYISTPLTVNIHVIKDIRNYITWTSPSNLGTLVNGQVSELAIAAVSNLSKPIEYEITDGQLPIGLELLPSGTIIGRTTFQYFALDGKSCNIMVEDAADITVGMTVEGVGVASGSIVTALIDEHTVTVAPAIYATEGTELTFRNLMLSTEIITRTTSLSTTTSIDKGTTSFDCTFNFTAQATATDLTVSDTKDFTILINNYNRSPYENVYLRALPSIDQRQVFTSIIENTDIFPDSLIYRSNDPWFGKASDIKMLFLPGMTASSLETFANAIQLNHYNKKINFGNIKTARAVDSNFNTKYEVVYLEVTDSKAGAMLSMEPEIGNFYQYGNQSFHTLYPNSFENMTNRLSAGVGFTNRGALPDWMTSPQEDGRVLGLTRAIVLAYTIPGASKLIAYRLSNSGINFNNISFVADRYQIDDWLSQYYDVNTNSFTNTDYVRTLVTHGAEWAAITGTTVEAIPGPQTDTSPDIYAVPETDNKYIKFTQFGVYR
jgi:hypothetical protein